MEILDWPFRGTEALAAGAVTPHRLRTHFEMVHRNVYIARGKKLTAVTRAIAAWLWSGRSATAVGLSPAPLHRTGWIDDWLPAELNRRGRDKARDIISHSACLDEDEVCVGDGIALTTPARTAFDLGRRKGLTTAVIRLDALTRATELKVADVEMLAERHRGARGLIQLRQALPLVDAGADSPYETRIRLLIIRSGLPAPQTEIKVLDDRGAVAARIGMGWPECKVGVEFDSAGQWNNAARSDAFDRSAELEARGWTIVRVNTQTLKNRPDIVVTQVRHALVRRT